MSSLCRVWMTGLDALRPEHVRLLSPVERARRESFRFDDDRARFTLGVALTRLAVGDWAQRAPRSITIERRCPRCGLPHGRPRLPGTGLHVSVSHAGRVVVVALTAAGPVGVDVEHRQGRMPEPRAVALGGSEHPEAGAQFTRLWCRKESVVKATGEGMRVALSTVVVSPADEPPRLVSYRGSPLDACLVDLDAPEGYTAALTVLTAKPVEVQVVADARRLLDAFVADAR